MKLLLQPLPVRIFHWVMAACVAALLFTGLYLNSPFAIITLTMRAIRKIQAVSGIILIANIVGQMYYYAVTTKFTEILFLPRDIANIRSFIRYVLFITDNHPNFGRYNPGQKLLFTLWFIAVLTAGFTGMALLFPDNTFQLQRLLGGLNKIRSIHFWVAVFFTMSVPLHLYLVFTESPAKLQAMFTGYINKELKLKNVKKNIKEPGI